MALPKKQEKLYTVADIYHLPEGTRAELVDGEIYYMAPPSTDHQELLGRIYREILDYIDSKNGKCKVFLAPFAVFLDEATSTYLEPDISAVCDPDKVDSQGCKGAPDWVIEIVSPSSRSRDYLVKLNLYMDAGVREYWIVDHAKDRITIYNFEKKDVWEYHFRDTVPASIFKDLEIDFSRFLPFGYYRDPV